MPSKSRGTGVGMCGCTDHSLINQNSQAQGPRQCRFMSAPAFTPSSRSPRLRGAESCCWQALSQPCSTRFRGMITCVFRKTEPDIEYVVNPGNSLNVSYSLYCIEYFCLEMMLCRVQVCWFRPSISPLMMQLTKHVCWGRRLEGKRAFKVNRVTLRICD